MQQAYGVHLFEIPSQTLFPACPARIRSGAIVVAGLLLCIATMPPAFAAEPSPQPAVAAQPASTQPAAIIHVENIEHDFGDVWAGEELKYAFEIFNRGTQPLQIHAAPQCGCTVAGDYPKTIEPGKSGKVPFSLKTLGFSGAQSKSITIESNDPVTPKLQLKLRGTFKPRVDLSPTGAFFGSIVSDESKQRVIKIINNTTTPLTLKLQPVKTDRFKFELTEITPGKQFELRVSTVLPHKPGDLVETAIIDTNLPEQKTLRITASGRIPDRLDLYPLVITYSRPGQPVFFWLNNYGASLVSLQEATTEDPAIKTMVESRTPGKAYRIQVQIPAGVTIPPQGRTLTVKTDDPEKPELKARIIPMAVPRPATQPHIAVQPLGRPAPAFKLTTFEQKALSNDVIKDGITVLNFISPACPWCKRALPELEAVRASYQGKGVRFVNVINPNPTRTHEYSREEVTQMLEGLNSHLESAFDPDTTVGAAFGAASYPTMMVIGKDLKVAAVNVGANRVADLSGQLDALLAGKPLPSPKPNLTKQNQPAVQPLGLQAPAFKLTTFEDKPFSSEDLNNAITVLNFISPACPWCKKALPELEPIRAAYQEKGVRFVNVINPNPTRTHEYSREEVTKMLDDLNAHLESAFDPGTTVGMAFGATGYPTMMVVGKDRKVAAVNVGANRIADLSVQLDALLAGKPITTTQPVN